MHFLRVLVKSKVGFFNAFVLNAPFLYLLKTSENRKVFFLIFSRDRERVHLKRMGSSFRTLRLSGFESEIFSIHSSLFTQKDHPRFILKSNNCKCAIM